MYEFDACMVYYVFSGCINCMISFVVCVFFFKQKTAYEMRISDWSSDVCSSDLLDHPEQGFRLLALDRRAGLRPPHQLGRFRIAELLFQHLAHLGEEIGRASCRERVCQYV